MSPSRYSIQRKHARYSLDVRAKLSAGKQEISVRTLDVSEGGVGLICPGEIPEDSSFVVEFDFPSVPGTFRCEVHAKNKVGFRHGFSFVNPDENSMALLRKYQRRAGVLAKDYATKG